MLATGGWVKADDKLFEFKTQSFMAIFEFFPPKFKRTSR